MANILDYMAWRGDLTLAQDPWNEIDSLIMACLVYNDYPAEAATHTGIPFSALTDQVSAERNPKTSRQDEERLELLLAAAQSKRFGEIVIHDYVDELDKEEQKQFAAFTCDLPDGECFVSMRGTDGTVVGWREDFNMAFKTVPAQKRAVEYLEQAASLRSGSLYVAGHSKGGNLAMYAAAHAMPEVRSRLNQIIGFDSPGLDDETLASEEYHDILMRLHAVIPQGSIVGMLMNRHSQPMIVRSTENGIKQHDAFSWQLLGKRFEVAEKVDATSVMVSEVTSRWLDEQPPEQREKFVNTLFDMLETAEPDGKIGSRSELSKQIPFLVRATAELPAETRKAFIHQMGRFVTIAGEDVMDNVRDKKVELNEALDKFRMEISENTAAVRQVIENLLTEKKETLPKPSAPSLLEEIEKRKE